MKEHRINKNNDISQDHQPGKRSFMGLGNRLVMWFVVFAVLPVIMTGIVGHVILMSNTKSQVEKLMVSVVSMMKHDVEHYFEDIGKDVEGLSRRTATISMMKMLKEISGKKGRLDQAAINNFESIKKEFEKNILVQHLGFDSYRDVFLIDIAGVVRYSKNGGIKSEVALFKETEGQSLFAKAVKSAMNSEMPVFSDYEMVIQNGTPVSVGYMVAALKDRAGDLAGLLAVCFEVDGLNAIVDNHLDLGRTFDIFIGGPDGKLRTDTGHRNTGKTLPYWAIDKGGAGSETSVIQDQAGINRYETNEGATLLWTRTAVGVSGVMFNLIAEIEENEAFALKDKIWMALFLLTVLITVCLTGVAVIVSGRIIQPLAAMGEWAEDVATGDLSLRDITCPYDEMARFVQSFRLVLDSLKDTARLATDVSAGDYSTAIEPRSAHDELGASLKRMTESLKDASRAMEAVAAGDFHAQVKVKGPNDLFAKSLNSMVQKIRETHEQGRTQARQKSLQAELNEIMRGDKTLEELCRNILSFLCICFKAAIGAFYIRADGAEQLRLYSGFALSAHRSLPLSIKAGEGLAGQAMVEKRKIILSECPEYFLNAQALVGEMRMMSVVAFPFVREGRVEGVVELGVPGRFSTKELDFLDLVSESVAIAIVSAVSRLRMKELLDQTVKQADDLRMKQDELNLINRHKSEFLANMSHELRTPLNSILLISGLMEENRQGNLTARQVEFAQTIHSAGLDLLNLVDDILDLARIEAGKLELMPIRASLRDLEHKVHLNFDDICRVKGISLITKIENNTPENVYVDLKRVDQVLKNLVSNAVKFTPSGHVKVDFSAIQFLPSERMEKDDTSQDLKIIVQDTGPGIPYEKQEAVFDAFCQADGTIGKKYGGTGLGLSISRELVRLMGGDLTLESMEGRGSTFIVTIPGVFGAEACAGEEEIGLLFQACPEDPVPTELPVVCSEDLSGKKILIADDDMRNVYALIHCLENEGPEIIVGKNGTECVEILEREGDVDLVIMDVMMAGMGGFEAMKKIRGDVRFKDLPVICVTARAMKGDREKSLEAGATEYVSKPVDMNSLMTIMKDLLRRSPENEIKEKL